MSQTSYPVLAPVEAKDPSGQLFAKVVSLPTGGNMALYRSYDEDNTPIMKIVMNAYGVQAISDMRNLNNKDAISKLIELTEQDKCEKIHGYLRETLAKSSPTIVSIFELNSVMAAFGAVSPMKQTVARVEHCEGQDLLLVRMEVKKPGSQSGSAINVVGHAVSEMIEFANDDIRDAAFENPKELAEVLSAVAIRQSGSEVAEKATRSRPKGP